MSTIIIDFDYVLLNASLLKQAIISVLSDAGITAADFENAYRATVTEGAQERVYVPSVHAELLARESSVAVDDLCRIINGVADRSSEFLYPGAKDFLVALRDAGHRLRLLTLGEEEWQRRKIAGSGIMNTFDAIIVSSLPKRLSLADALVGVSDSVCVINDNPGETMDMAAAFPALHYLLKRGPYLPAPDFPFPICEGFDTLFRLCV